ncbi:MAG TPA: molybdenum cofactor biosynthesis protein MoaE [Pyrinomonadaceae bacterium]|jgi:molybdopterin synthase catalytic subunit
MFEITEDNIQIDQLLHHVGKSANGAIVTFVGIIREMSRGHKVLYLEYQAYQEMAILKMRQIGEEIREKWAGVDVAIVHRVGHLEVGDCSVVIAVASSERKVPFEACEYAINRLKEIVPIWKKEVWEDGEAWIGDRS